jgi:thiamine biosynthesis lipoprotein
MSAANFSHHKIEGPSRNLAVRARVLRGLFAIAIAIGTLGTTGCSEHSTPEPLLELSGSTMGTTYQVKLSVRPEDLPRGSFEQLQTAIDQRLEAINGMMSTYRSESDLSRFNAGKETGWVSVPAPLIEVIEAAQTISRMSTGKFDITVGPLVELWGFGPGERPPEPPDDAQIAAALKLVGFQKLQVRIDPPALRKSVAGLQIDLSAIAKGYAVDQIAELLEQAGIDRYLVEIGGELRAKGRKSDSRPWRVAIERPDPSGRSAQSIIELHDQAMATSGDYRNFFEHDGRRYPHTIDPRSGQSIRQALASVTVLADDCMIADGLATALLAMGEEAGPELAESHEIAAQFIVRTEQGLQIRRSSRFRDRHGADPGGDQNDQPVVPEAD